jgi:hypothetical protein
LEAWAAAFPQDVLDERAFYAQKKAKRRAEKDGIRVRKRFIEMHEAGPSTIDDNNDRWDGYVLERAFGVVGIGLGLLRLDVSTISF